MSNSDGLVFVEDNNIGGRYWLLTKYSALPNASALIFNKRVTVVFHNKYASGVLGKNRENKDLLEANLYADGEMVKKDIIDDYDEVEKTLKIYWQFSKECETMNELVGARNVII